MSKIARCGVMSAVRVCQCLLVSAKEGPLEASCPYRRSRQPGLSCRLTRWRRASGKCRLSSSAAGSEGDLQSVSMRRLTTVDFSMTAKEHSRKFRGLDTYRPSDADGADAHKHARDQRRSRERLACSRGVDRSAVGVDGEETRERH